MLALQEQRDDLLRPASQEEILQRLEQRVGPEGRESPEMTEAIMAGSGEAIR